MMHLIRSVRPFALLLVSMTAAVAPCPSQQSLADQFADRQDYGVTPPDRSAALEDILWFVSPNGHYESLGPPFTSPRPPLPTDLTYVRAFCKKGWYVTNSSPWCVVRWSRCRVDLTFTDGSTFTYTEQSRSTQCGTTVTYEFSSSQRADAGPPGFGIVDSAQRRDHYAWAGTDGRKHSWISRPGRTVAFPAVTARPIVGGGELEIRVGPGGSLDLRTNAAAGGPLFVTDTPALLFCDTILLDPGVALADLFQPPPHVQPATGQAVAALVLPEHETIDDPAPRMVQVAVANQGNADDVFLVSWADTLGWITPGQSQVVVVAGREQSLQLNIQVQPGTPNGVLSEVFVQAAPMSMPSGSTSGVIRVSHDPLGVIRFGAGTPGCAGAFAVDASAPLEAGGPATQLECSLLVPSAPALWMVGFDVAPGFGTWQYPGLPDFHVDPFGSLFLTFFVFADATGAARTGLQAPADPLLVGLEITCQALSPTGPCSPAAISSSPALALMVQ